MDLAYVDVISLVSNIIFTIKSVFWYDYRRWQGKEMLVKTQFLARGVSHDVQANGISTNGHKII